MLAERTEYLSAGVHIGMKSCTKYLKNFVYKIRDDGLAVFNLRKVDARLVVAANFISSFDSVLVISRKSNAADAIVKFAEVTGARAIPGRFSPGTLTNPSYRDFVEPDVIILVDPLVDENAVKEAKKKRVPIVALCDTFNEASDIDLAIPANNNGKKSLALVFMLLAREILKNRGKIKKDSDFNYTMEDFGADVQQPQADQEGAQAPERREPRKRIVKAEKPKEKEGGEEEGPAKPAEKAAPKEAKAEKKEKAKKAAAPKKAVKKPEEKKAAKAEKAVKKAKGE